MPNRNAFNNWLKFSLVVPLVLIVTGCGTRVDAMAKTAKYAIWGAPDVTLTQQQIEELPYAAQYVTLEGQARAMLVLGFDDSNQLHWLSGQKESLVTQSGRIISMVNVDKPHDTIDASIHSTAYLTDDPLHCLTQPTVSGQQNCPRQWQAEISTAPGVSQKRYQIKTTFDLGSSAEVDLPSGHKASAVKLTEKVISQSQGQTWHYTNYYWLEDSTRRIIKSSQQYIPEFPRAHWLEVKAYSKHLQQDTES